ncbi:protein EXPORTIN 1A [Trifolium repens]|nr:protein EXPORTIN 1A [Trifolium repens]
MDDQHKTNDPKRQDRGNQLWRRSYNYYGIWMHVIELGHRTLLTTFTLLGFNHSSSSSSSSSDIAAENLRDLSQPIDVPLLDTTVAAFYCTGSKQERSASILRDLQNNPDMWFQVMHILQNTKK